VLGDRPVDSLTVADVAGLVAKLDGAGKAREWIRKSVTALAMVLDFANVTPNHALDRRHVKLPLEEPDEPESPSADHVEAVGWLRIVIRTRRYSPASLRTGCGWRSGALAVTQACRASDRTRSGTAGSRSSTTRSALGGDRRARGPAVEARHR
jgi:hypothetical protein